MHTAGYNFSRVGVLNADLATLCPDVRRMDTRSSFTVREERSMQAVQEHVRDTARPQFRGGLNYGLDLVRSPIGRAFPPAAIAQHAHEGLGDRGCHRDAR